MPTPNVIKWSTATQSGVLRKGNFYLGVTDRDYGPTVDTGYWSGITPPSDGYTLYLNKAENGPSIYTAADDSQLIGLVNSLYATNSTTIDQAITYVNAISDAVVVNKNYEPIVTDGLVLNLDAGFVSSYPRGGTGWNDISNTSLLGTIFNGASYSSDSISFDGVDDSCTLPNSSSISFTTNFTLEIRIKLNTYKDIAIVMGKGDGGGIITRYNYMFIGTGISFYFRVANSTTGINSPVVSSSNFPTGRWAIITGVLDSEKIRLYLNGAEIQSGNTRTINPATNTDPLYISSSQYSLNGSISTCRIYNRALTPYEIYLNYASRLPSNLVIDGSKFKTSWISLANLTSTTANSVLAPDGTLTATLFERVSVASQGHAQLRQNIDLIPNTTYSVSFWARRVSLTQRIDFEFADNPFQITNLTDEWKFYSFYLTTNATFPNGEFIDIGSTSVSSGSQLNEKYSIWNLHIAVLQ